MNYVPSNDHGDSFAAGIREGEKRTRAEVLTRLRDRSRWSGADDPAIIADAFERHWAEE